MTFLKSEAVKSAHSSTCLTDSASWIPSLDSKTSAVSNGGGTSPPLSINNHFLKCTPVIIFSVQSSEVRSYPSVPSAAAGSALVVVRADRGSWRSGSEYDSTIRWTVVAGSATDTDDSSSTVSTAASPYTDRSPWPGVFAAASASAVAWWASWSSCPELSQWRSLSVFVSFFFNEIFISILSFSGTPDEILESFKHWLLSLLRSGVGVGIDDLLSFRG